MVLFLSNHEPASSQPIIKAKQKSNFVEISSGNDSFKSFFKDENGALQYNITGLHVLLNEERVIHNSTTRVTKKCQMKEDKVTYSSTKTTAEIIEVKL